ncbi:ATP-binding protein [Streptomyces tsukubensis]|uniref:ATP-binding protein n=1 Tax=Streptomyces tsukubensis TaxID=83656 RepID=A0A1V4AAA1_9ACTN|nr:ATP-binding protein [Streptomyces tsukubensis]OON79620.1 ATP-binding protein [Streptomyces tsukubensis]QFR95805.1 ATP-binding protein [Streptomyces tsukubensis]
MAGLEGIEQARRPGSPAAPRWTPTVEDERALETMESHGNPVDAEVVLDSAPGAAATARRLAEIVVVAEWGLSPHLAECTALLVSELFGNAVEHTGARAVGLRMHRRPGRIRVEVRDPSRSLPCMMPAFEMEVVSGYGLLLVEKLSDRWGADLLPIGKKTWFEIRVSDR